MSNLYIVESPLQALCALEVSLGIEGEKHSIIIRLSDGSRPRSDEQIQEVVNRRVWSKKIIIKSYSNSIMNQYNQLQNLKMIKKKFRDQVSSLYIGEFRYPFMHMAKVAIEADRTFLLDDGAASLKVIDDYINKGISYPFDRILPKGRSKEFLFSVLFSQYLDYEIMNEKITVLSAFTKRESDFVKKLTFNNIRKSINSNIETNQNVVYFFGSKYSEAGIITLDYELVFLRRVRDFYLSKNKEVVYFAHRDESKSKLTFLSENLGFEVIKSNLIAELYFLDSRKLPKEFAGAYTSVLNNLKVLFPEVLIRSFRLKAIEVDIKYRENINSVYKYYTDLEINIED